VMKGYWKNPQATAEVMTSDGFLRTGDVGYMDADGYVYIVDRTKDMLLCGGYNVYPRVIEEAIFKHPAVEEVCVIGVKDAYRGQSPKAFIKLKGNASALTLDELKIFLRDKLGKHEMVQAIQRRGADGDRKGRRNYAINCNRVDRVSLPKEGSRRYVCAG